MSVTTRTVQRQPGATRAVVRQLASERANARLPLTFLGTHGDNRHPLEQGWQAHMWSHHAFVSGAVYAASIAVHAAVENGILPEPGWSMAYAGTVTAMGATGLFAAAGGLIATAGERFSDWARAYFTATPLAATAYLIAVSATSPFSTGNLAAIAAGTAVGMGMYYQMRTQQDATELKYVARFASQPTPAARQAVARPVAPMPALIEDDNPEFRKWNKALADVGLKGCRVLSKMDTPAGYAMKIGLPPKGNVSPEAVGKKLEQLERCLGMLRDVLEFDVATHPGNGRELSDRCWIIVDVEDILSQLIEMPDDHAAHQPARIADTFTIGTFMDGTPMTLRLREIAALIVGVRGRGKTNLFHVLVHRLSQCTDVVLWAIDLKGGRAVKPWLKPWLDETAERPVFDWVATTRAEAMLMVKAANVLIKWRGNASSGGSKINPSPDNPAVLILIDEFAAIAGKHAGRTMTNKAKDWWRDPSVTQMTNVITESVQLGRSEAVDFVFFTQRSTVTMSGSGDLKSQCELRIGLGVTNPNDAQSVFQNNQIAAKKLRKLKNKRTRGACLIENGEDDNHLAGKTYYYGDDDAMLSRIHKAATLHAMNPADLPEAQQQAIDDALMELTDGECGYGVGPYAASDQRWSMDRAAHLYTDGLAPEWDDTADPEDLLGAEPTSGVGTATATMTRPRTTPRPTSAPPTPARPGPTAPTYNKEATMPTSPGHPPVLPEGYTGSRYYVPRADRDQDSNPPPNADDRETLNYQREFDNMVQFLTAGPAIAEPVYDLADPEQQTRYELMLTIVERAGAAGISPGEIMKAMVKSGNCWSQRTQLYPALKRAVTAKKIVQPIERGPYYTPAHAPKRAS